MAVSNGGFETTNVQDIPPSKENPYWSKIVTMVNRECKTCRWLNTADSGASDGNTCRRHAPVNVASHQMRVFPYVHNSDWCGDWEKRND